MRQGRLGRLEQLEAATVAQRRIRLTGLEEAWRLGDASSKRDLLATLFHEIDVFDGRIVAVKPRADLIVEVTDLIDRAYDEPIPGAAGGLLGVDREGSRPTSNKPRIRV